jgi:MoaA/NifB/PqqE/SkfB family radical SAM enzyme
MEARLEGHYRADATYRSVAVNVTNRCNLACQHCFVFRAGNPNERPARARDEPGEDSVLDLLALLRDRHGIRHALWMGGEPMLRRRLVERGLALFRHNTITTNGRLPLVDFDKGVLYVVSLDGPEEANDAIRGQGSFRRVLRTLERLPEGFGSPVQAQCTVTRRNQALLSELVELLRGTRIGWITFSFHVPGAHDYGPDAWPDCEAREPAVREVLRLRHEYPGFVRNSRRSLELMLPEHARRVTDACPARARILPLYLDGGRFVTPACC